MKNRTSLEIFEEPPNKPLALFPLLKESPVLKFKQLFSWPLWSSTSWNQLRAAISRLSTKWERVDKLKTEQGAHKAVQIRTLCQALLLKTRPDKLVRGA